MCPLNSDVLLSILEQVKGCSADLKACASVSRTWRDLAFAAKGSLKVTSGPTVAEVLKLLADYPSIHTVCLYALEEIDVLLMSQGIAREAVDVKTLHLVSCKALCSMGTSGLLVTFSISQQGHVADYQRFSIERSVKGQRSVRWRLRELLLSGSPLDDHQLQALLDSGRGSHLERLTLCRCPKLRGWGLSHVFEKCCPNLQSLTLADMDHLSRPNPRLPPAEQGPLQSLRAHRLASGLSSGLLTGLVAGVSTLPPSLKTLALRGLGAASLLPVAAELCPQLRALYVSVDCQAGHFSIGDVARGQLAKLEVLGVAETVPRAAMASFLVAHPGVRVVNESGPLLGGAEEWGLPKAAGGPGFKGGLKVRDRR
ncbi:hypothetical protein KFL_000090610 [Klebsormidium nitens]|uniref:F-box domain-containing protein n=1 Tax=Klebsormidium nitens TaxID=105231 RepID=A0A1Y1HIA8_KLENI|nr:hypothetical protein KFL_000090610 [Klebsormidium nitens]|eukprot:GAQ78215.1 hypothetical protein KFL_000090610 [Klebsormidium nitens]